MKKFLNLLLLSLLVVGVQGGAAQAQERTYTNSIGLEFVLIPAGSFMMGSEEGEDERPVHQVTISQPFYLGKFEVTQAQWEAVMGQNPSKFEGRDNPVEQVSWNDVQEFIKKLNEKEGHGRYRLPTEAEWEYAARAGTDTAYFFGDDKNELYSYAWYVGNSGGSTHPVGQKPANAWGLYDVHGNVWEWVEDWYGNNYPSVAATDPKGPTFGIFRVLRGGSWLNLTSYCRSALRGYDVTGNRRDSVGFRLALTPE